MKSAQKPFGNGIIDSVKHAILDYVLADQKIKECEKKLLEHGRSTAFNASIERLEAKRAELSAESGISQDTFDRYNDLAKEIALRFEQLQRMDSEKPILEFIGTPFVYIPGITTINENGTPSYDLDRVPTVKETIQDAVDTLNSGILDTWPSTISAAKQQLVDAYATVNANLDRLREEYEPLQAVVARNDELKKIEEQLEDEYSRLKQSQELENEKEQKIKETQALRKKILESRQEMRDAYDTFKRALQLVNEVETELKFDAEIVDRTKDLFTVIANLFDNRGFRSFKEKYGYSLQDKDELVVDDGLFDSLWDAMTTKAVTGSLSLKAGNTLQVALERLFSDWFYIHFVVKSGDDTINSMSPGKKALVLLEMIINLEKGNCPILIDQPEDDLDNRSIYVDLVQYLKQKKHERQIIVVTHNANVVIGADAEEVIIANQDGKEARNREKRFEYRCGAIENTRSCTDEHGYTLSGVLNEKGIQEQICDILEGGKEAFDLRKNKYFGGIVGW